MCVFHFDFDLMNGHERMGHGKDFSLDGSRPSIAFFLNKLFD